MNELISRETNKYTCSDIWEEVNYITKRSYSPPKTFKNSTLSLMSGIDKHLHGTLWWYLFEDVNEVLWEW